MLFVCDFMSFVKVVCTLWNTLHNTTEMDVIVKVIILTKPLFVKSSLQLDLKRNINFPDFVLYRLCVFVKTYSLWIPSKTYPFNLQDWNGTCSSLTLFHEYITQHNSCKFSGGFSPKYSAPFPPLKSMVSTKKNLFPFSAHLSKAQGKLL